MHPYRILLKSGTAARSGCHTAGKEQVLRMDGFLPHLGDNRRFFRRHQDFPAGAAAFRFLPRFPFCSFIGHFQRLFIGRRKLRLRGVQT